MQSPLGPELKQALLGFRALPGFKAQNPGDGAWSVHKTLFGFRVPLLWPFCPKLSWVLGEIFTYLATFALKYTKTAIFGINYSFR